MTHTNKNSEFTQMPHQLLTGKTWHARYIPSKHSFSYPYRYWGLNLNLLAADDGLKVLPQVVNQQSIILRVFKQLIFKKLFSDKGTALHSFNYADYFDVNNLDETNSRNSEYLKKIHNKHEKNTAYLINKNSASSWLFQVRKEFQRLTNSQPTGDILALIVSRNLGFYFSPVNFYIGFDKKGNASHLLAEVSNTPWNKSHYYGFLLENYKNGDSAEFSHKKDFHVSPFNPIDQVYKWSVQVSPSKNNAGCMAIKLSIHVSDTRGKVFKAGINMQSKPLTQQNIHESVIQNPIMNYSSMGRIYWHALILYVRKKVNYIDYNQKLNESKQAMSRQAQPVNNSADLATNDNYHLNPMTTMASSKNELNPSKTKAISKKRFRFIKKGVETMSTAMTTSSTTAMNLQHRQPTERNQIKTLDKLVSNPLLKPLSNGINTNINKLCKRLLHKLLVNFQFGQVTIIETYQNNHKPKTFGSLNNNGSVSINSDISKSYHGEIAGNHPLVVTLKVHDPIFYQKAIRGGSIALADSYINGDWEVDDLTAFIRLGARNLSTVNKIESKFSRLTKAIEKNKHKLRQNTISNSKSNILAHYDLGNEMYQTFLDDTMMYSAAIYKTPTTALADAQQLKLKTLCEQLELNSSDRVIEIGTGWGGFAIYAATHYGCHVTTTTISDAQYEEAKKRVIAAELNDKITLLKEDYRNLTGKYDKLISIEMVEAVGYEFLPTFFAKCNKLLKEDGIMTIQAITFNDQGYEGYLNSVDFIQSHIFPGGCLLSNQELINQFTKETDMVVKSLTDYGYDYAYTLRDWRHEFMNRLDDIKAMGYDDTFIRLWHFYFAYCEGGFLEKTIGVVQVKAIKPRQK